MFCIPTTFGLVRNQGVEGTWLLLDGEEWKKEAIKKRCAEQCIVARRWRGQQRGLTS